MNNKSQLTFVMFVIYSLSEAWGKLPSEVYHILNDSGILDNYLIKCYDTLHTLGKEYLVEDITSFVEETGVII